MADIQPERLKQEIEDAVRANQANEGQMVDRLTKVVGDEVERSLTYPPEMLNVDLLKIVVDQADKNRKAIRLMQWAIITMIVATTLLRIFHL